MKACFVCGADDNRVDYVYSGGRKETIAALTELAPENINRENLAQYRDFLREVEVVFATWNMINFTGDELAEYFPRLKILFYGAGSVRRFAEPFLQRGIRVVSSWQVMAKAVAELTVSEIIQANKGFFHAAQRFKRGEGWLASRTVSLRDFPGTYGTKVGILGAGAIGSHVIRLLHSYDAELMVYDPFLSAERAQELGVSTHPLEEIFSQCQTISNHIANNPQTVGMLDYRLFSLMKHNAAFLNTGRGAQVVEADLIRALKEQPLRCAILDVTDPEPPEPGSELYKLDNVILTPHIAGFAAREVWRMSDFIIGQFRQYLGGGRLRGEVTLEMLPTML